MTSKSKAKLAPYEKFLKKFEYQNALNAALEVWRWDRSCCGLRLQLPDRCCDLLPAVRRCRKRLCYSCCDLSQTRDPIVIVSLIEELRLRDGLTLALSGRDETTLEPLVAFIAKYITHPRYAALLIGITDRVFGACYDPYSIARTPPLPSLSAMTLSLCGKPRAFGADMYAPMLGRSIAIDRLFLRLQSRIQQEIKLDKQLLALQGGLDLVMASAGQQAVAHLESSAL